MTGHRDWHEQTASAAEKIASASPDWATAKAPVLLIVDRLGFNHGDVEFALMRSCLLPDMELEEALSLRTSVTV